MKITQIKTYTVADSKVKALVSITLDDCFVITGLKIIQSDKGLFIAMPNRKTPSGEYKDTIYPVTKEFRQELQDAILKEYNGQAEASNGEFITLDDTEILPF